MTSASPRARAPLSVAARSQSCAGIGESVGNRPRAESAAVRISPSMSRSLLQAAASVPSATVHAVLLEHRRRAFAAARVSDRDRGAMDDAGADAAQPLDFAVVELGSMCTAVSSGDSSPSRSSRLSTCLRSRLPSERSFDQCMVTGSSSSSAARRTRTSVSSLHASRSGRQRGRDQRIVAILVVQGEPLRQAFVGGAGPHASACPRRAGRCRRGCAPPRLPAPSTSGNRCMVGEAGRAAGEHVGDRQLGAVADVLSIHPALLQRPDLAIQPVVEGRAFAPRPAAGVMAACVCALTKPGSSTCAGRSMRLLGGKSRSRLARRAAPRRSVR